MISGCRIAAWATVVIFRGLKRNPEGSLAPTPDADSLAAEARPETRPPSVLPGEQIAEISVPAL